MKDPCLHQVYRLNAYLVGILSIAANLTLAVLVLRYTTPELKKYSRVLLISCISEILFAASCAIIDAHLSFRGGILFVVVNGYSLGSYDANFAMMIPYIYTIYATLSIGSIPLIFRYFSICRQRTLTWMQLAPFVVAALTLPLVIIIAVYYIWYENGEGILLTLNFTIESLPCGDPGQIPLFTADQIMSAPSLSVPILISVFHLAITYSVIVFCIVKVFVTVHRGAFSSKTRSLQRQLNTALLFQALSPLLIMVIPLGLRLGALLLRIDRAGDALPAASAIPAWIPVVNPLTTIYFIRAYREAVVRGMRTLTGVKVRPHIQDATVAMNSGTLPAHESGHS